MKILKSDNPSSSFELTKSFTKTKSDILDETRQQIAQLVTSYYLTPSLQSEKKVIDKCLNEILQRLPAVKKYFFYQNDFYKALIQKEIQKVEAYLNQNRYFFDFNPHFGLTCIHLAVIIASKELLLLFIQHNFPIDVPDNMGKTALHYAALVEDDVFFTTLLANGANPWAKDNHDVTPLELFVHQQKNKS